MSRKRCQICKLKPANKKKSHHHLTPKYNGNHRKDKTPMCKDCHETIHRLFTNKELYEEYNELEKLKEELKNRLIGELLNGFNFLTEVAEEVNVAPVTPEIVMPELSPDLHFGGCL